MHVYAHAPVRTADLGGWTDTWFAASGKVCNVAVEPGISVELRAHPHDASPGAGYLRVVLLLPTGRQEFDLPAEGSPPGADPLVCAALQHVRPPGDITISLTSGVPAGSGLGTSAAVAVALLAGLHTLRGEAPARSDLALEAHAVETSLGLQSGIQDQLGAAFGGTHLFDISYPRLVADPQRLDDATTSALGASLVTVYLGRPHRSSEIHEQVIASLEAGDNEAWLEPLRRAAVQGFKALCDGDIDAYGRAMQANHEAQKGLHPALVSDLAETTIDAARRFGARGWKVNGAGGEGGSLCLLAPTDPAQLLRMLDSVAAIEDVGVLDLRVASVGVVTRTLRS